MGLNWSEPKSVKGGSLIVVSSKFPTDKQEQKGIWDIWKLKKDEVKMDGFSVGKDKLDDNWRITYFHEVKNTNVNEKTLTGKLLWKSDMDKKVKKWGLYLSEIKNIKIDKPKVSSISDYTPENDDADLEELAKFIG